MIDVQYFSKPSEVMNNGKGKVEMVKVNDAMLSKIIFEPGWKWSTHIGPLAKTSLCEATHFIYLTSGTLHVKMADGTEIDLKPGSVSLIPPGHDAWVVGNEAAVGLDFQGAVDAATKLQSVGMGVHGVVEKE